MRDFYFEKSAAILKGSPVAAAPLDSSICVVDVDSVKFYFGLISCECMIAVLHFGGSVRFLKLTPLHELLL